MRMWEIRENYEKDYKSGSKHDKIQEAYDCGFEDGYEKAMEESRDSSTSYKMSGGFKRRK